MMDRRDFLYASGVAGLAGLLPGIGVAASSMSDLTIIRTALTKLHPGLYRYLSPKKFDANFAMLEREWAASNDLAMRYLALSRFLAKIRCGHSYANFFNQKKALASALFDRPTRLPFTFRWIGNDMVVLQSPDFAAGTVITRIDGLKPSEMLKALMPYARADGSNDDKRRALLAVNGREKIDYFDVFQGLIFPPKNSKFGIEAKLPGGERKRVALAPLTLAERQKSLLATEDAAEPWTWNIGQDGIAVLRMDGWALYNSKWDWKAWLSERLDSLAGAKGLIVDIRENEGGLDCGDLILARRTRQPLPAAAYRRLVRYRETPEELNAYLDTWDDSFRTLGKDAKIHDGRYFELPPEEEQAIAPQGRFLDLPMVVLTSAQNSSATFGFAQMVKTHRLGTLIGETTGGNQRGINGGRYFFVRLPESGIEFDLPLVGYFPDQPMPDVGITPDIAVPVTIADIAAGRDRQMETARDWINRS